MNYPDDFINKIICGNCLEVMKDIPNDSIDLVITSPPYNMRTRIRNGEYTTREKSEHFSKKYRYFDDDLSIDDYYKFHKKVLNELLRISNLIFWNIQIVTGSKEAIFKLIGDFNKQIKDVVVWDKGFGQPAMHENVLNRATELIIIFERNGTGRTFTKSYFDRGTMDDIWRINRGKSNKEHNASYPVGLVNRILLGWSKESDIVLDPFIGIGTTAIACKKLNRNYIGIEISKEYCDIARKRINATPEPLFI